MSVAAPLLGTRPMGARQVLVVAVCILLNALDGFDVLAISFAAPGIAAEWRIDRAVLGVVLSMELIGMAAGSVLIGRLADRAGRRPVILGCLVVMAVGMAAAPLAPGVGALSAARLLTGLGIGGMLAATSAMVAEFSNDRRRALAATLNIAGYSAGAILGGLIASALLGTGGAWRGVFLLGGGATLVALPLAIMLLPESPDFMAARGGSPDRVNAVLARLRQPPLGSLPARAPIVRGRLLEGGYGRATATLAVAYFAQIMLFYFVQKWIPKIVVDMGFAAGDAGRVLVWANVGSLSGAITIGLVSQRLAVRPLVIAAMLLGAAAIVLFGVTPPLLWRLALAAAVAAFFINAGVVGLYPIMAQTYAADVRASGTGFVIGVGRGGSALGPVIAGSLFASGAGLPAVALSMASGGVLAAAMLLLLPVLVARRPTRFGEGT